MQGNVTKSFAYGVLAMTAILVASSGCSNSSFSGDSSKAAPAVTPQAAAVQSVATPAPTAMPTPAPSYPPAAVTQGSFTAWAIPQNPLPGQNYDIHIVVRLPSANAGYAATDLSGMLIGTDGYQQTINQAATMGHEWQSFSYLPGSTQAELIMHVPGASSMVLDTVNIRSAMLNESQSLSIRFQ